MRPWPCRAASRPRDRWRDARHNDQDEAERGEERARPRTRACETPATASLRIRRAIGMFYSCLYAMTRLHDCIFGEAQFSLFATILEFRGQSKCHYFRSHPTRITCATCSRARSAARPAMNSPYRSAACIIAQSTAPVRSKLGGGQAASIQSRSPASCGKTPALMRGGSSRRAPHKLPPQIKGRKRAVTFWSLRRRPEERRYVHRDCGM